MATAKRLCKEFLEKYDVTVVRPRGTLEEVCAVYLKIGKGCTLETAEANISRLRHVVKVACGKSLDDVPVAEMPRLWRVYVAKRQGREDPDYAAWERINPAINSAMKQAGSIFSKKLAYEYQEHGIILPSLASNIRYLPGVELEPEKAEDAKLCEAWEALAETDRDLWLAVGLARWAGLRQGEILRCRGGWIKKRTGGAVVELKNRFAEGHRGKTRRAYTAIILHTGLAEYLLAIPPDDPVINRPDAERWLGRAPQNWLRPFTGAAQKPLHRCRGLYLDQVAIETEDAVLARRAGIQAAADAAGHTTTTTTVRHYLTPRE